ncbi:putative bifunctional diguanylate cyclase/phosphodiesterase [Thermithiobacillus plumbiphilus]|uniref:EAL domain-containing protein n=1 Tax=Thermithiobacillus plumbiphilus TaxID=1729899 RepID=A0ABU9DDG6_9PROT
MQQQRGLKRAGRLSYIEPTVRTLIGGFITFCGLLIFLAPQYTWLALLLLAFSGINLLLAGFTGFCILEKSLKLLNFRCELDEITELSKARAAAEARADYLNTLSLFDEVVIELSFEGRIMQVSDRWQELIGLDMDPKNTGQTLARYLHHEDRRRLEEALADLERSDSGTVSLRFRLAGQKKQEHWIEGRFIRHLRDGGNTGIRGVLRDVTDAYLQEKRITQLALHDALTGLPNRALLEDRLERAIIQATRREQKVAVMFIDLDNFKQVNDLHGHRAGDQLLLAVTRALQGNLRECDTLARWGGDEFIVLSPELGSAEGIRAIGERLLQSVYQKLLIDHMDVSISLSIGVAVFPDDADNGETLLVQADKALYHAKSQGRNNVQLFSTLVQSGVANPDFELGARLAAALRQQHIEVYYQPLVDAGTGQVTGVEALARWHDAKLGWVSPATFIPMAESMGLIQHLGRLVLEQALQQYSHWLAQGLDLRLAVNVSRRQLFSQDFGKYLQELVKQHAIRPEQLILEITESVATQDINQSTGSLRELAQAGFRLSLDDFGTGYSSLSQLHDMPVDELKIDISFVHRIKHRKGRSMVRTIVEMGHAMGLTLVAEGVEDAESARILAELGVETLQGFHFCHPLPAPDCHAFLLRKNQSLIDGAIPARSRGSASA